MESINNKEDFVCERLVCTGCGACSTVCPKNCIEMSADFEGFFHPIIDKTKCIGCDLCRHICPSIKKPIMNMDMAEAYVFINSNKSVLAKSSSGGFVPAVGEWMLDHHGVIYGCEYDKDFNAVFFKENTSEGLSAMRGSKYVESKAWPVYKEIKSTLNKGNEVLFIALPCQVSGLLATLNEKEKQHLITVDLLCHGVPSHKLFEAYLDELCRIKGMVVEYSFRNKKHWGWGSWGTYSYRSNEKIKEQKLLTANDYYYNLYFKENNYRESCYRCPYASLPRVSDFTAGDCWHIDEIDSSIKSRDGVSLVLVNSHKGKEVFDAIKNYHFTQSIPIDVAKQYNKTIICPANRPEQRDEFYRDFNRDGFTKAAKKYCKLHYVFPTLARYVPRHLKQGIKRVIKKHFTG